MMNFKKMTSDELRAKLKKVIKVQERCDYFERLQWRLERELDRRNRAAIFREACRVLKNRHFANQFAAAAHYANSVVNGSDYFSDDTHHEIGSYYTKSGSPVIVDF